LAQKKSHEVDRFIAKPDPNFSLVLIYGPDRGLVSERARKFAHNTGIDLTDPFSTIRMEAAEIDADPARLDDEARTISLFGGNRLIWLRGAGTQKGLLEAVKWLVKTPPQQVWILIEGGDLKKGTGLRNLIETAKDAMALPCYSDDARAMEGLIDEVLGEFHLRISHAARQILRENLGSDRLASRGELEKLALYAMKPGEHGEVTVDDILNCISDVSHNSQDHIIDALIDDDIASFSERFDRQCEAGTPLFLILSAAQRQFQQLQQLRDVMEREGKTAAAAVAGSRPPIFFQRQKTVERALERWSLPRLSHACARLQTTVLESRKTPLLGTAIIRQNLLALGLGAAPAQPKDSKTGVQSL